MYEKQHHNPKDPPKSEARPRSYWTLRDPHGVGVMYQCEFMDAFVVFMDCGYSELENLLWQGKY